MIKKGKKLSMMLLTAMILAAGSVGTVAGTGAKQVQAAENAYYYVSLGNLQQTAMTKNSASITWEQTYASSMNTLTTEGYNIYLGEIIDFRLFNNLNNNFDFKNTKWKKASLTDSPAENLTASYIDKIGISKSIDAKKIYINEKGNVLIDFEEMVEGFIDITFLCISSIEEPVCCANI